ncbi:MAG: hypothetical protein M1815_002015 [Lichina confinis]|nr:MAG: hypothetical protein M1815_002015 [Lichina confinis]
MALTISINPTTATTERRRNYPVAWGSSPDQMRIKRRVLCVYDGPNRLYKDDTLLDRDFEVRLKRGDGQGNGNGQAYVTDLDVDTLNRADEAYLHFSPTSVVPAGVVPAGAVVTEAGELVASLPVM